MNLVIAVGFLITAITFIILENGESRGAIKNIRPVGRRNKSAGIHKKIQRQKSKNSISKIKTIINSSKKGK